MFAQHRGRVALTTHRLQCFEGNYLGLLGVSVTPTHPASPAGWRPIRHKSRCFTWTSPPWAGMGFFSFSGWLSGNDVYLKMKQASKHWISSLINSLSFNKIKIDRDALYTLWRTPAQRQVTQSMSFRSRRSRKHVFFIMIWGLYQLLSKLCNYFPKTTFFLSLRNNWLKI